ncbi:MAG: SGNH/GDSL hydrolase family protein [Candidatus Microsaccharimonas sp.]
MIWQSKNGKTLPHQAHWWPLLPVKQGVVLAKADVGLGNIDNTADIDKPVSSATQTALDTKATRLTLGAFQVPARSTTGSGEWTSGLSYSSTATNTTLALRTSNGTLAAASGVSGNDLVNKTQLDLKLDASQKAAAGGVASLDANSHIPASQLGTGTADTTTYLRGDGSWQLIQGGGSTSTPGPAGAPGAMTIREDSANAGMYVISDPLDSSAISLLHGPKQTVTQLSKSAAIMFVGDSTSRAANNSALQFANAMVAEPNNSAYTIRYRETSSGNYPSVQTWTIGQPTVMQLGTNGERSADMLGTAGLSFPGASIIRTSQDLDLRIKLSAANWTATNAQTLISQRGGSGNYSFIFYLVNGELRFTHSVDGSNDLTSTVPVPSFTNNTTHWLRVTLDADNGSNGFTKSFYQSDDGVNWTLIADRIVSTGATSIFSQNYAWGLGTSQAGAGAGTSWRIGAGSKIFEVDIKDGINGLTVAPTLPDQWEPTEGGAATFSGAPIIDIWNCSVGGISTRKQYEFRTMLRPRINCLITFVALSHNDSYQTAPDYWQVWNQLLDDIQDRNPITSVILTAQNPRISGTGTNNEDIAAHAHRGRILEAVARRRGHGFVDIYQIFQDQFASGVATNTLIQSDGIHPNTAGYTLWGQTLADIWAGA